MTEDGKKMRPRAMSISYARLLCDVLSKNNIDYRPILGKAQIHFPSLEERGAYISGKQHLILVKESLKSKLGPSLGLHLGEATHPGTFHVLGYLCLNSKTIKEAFDNFCRYEQLVSNDGKKLALVNEGKNIRYIYKAPAIEPNYDRVRADFAISSAFKMTQFMLNRPDIMAKDVTFQHSRPTYPKEYKRVFQRQAKFSRPSNSLLLDASLFEQPLHQANPQLYKTLEKEAVRLIMQLNNKSPFSQKTAQVLQENYLNGFLNMDQVARSARLSIHLLRRHLKAEGTSFKKILQDVSKQIADSLSSDAKLSNKDIAYMMHYSEPSAFYRAFKKWFNMTLGDYRNQK